MIDPWWQTSRFCGFSMYGRVSEIINTECHNTEWMWPALVRKHVTSLTKWNFPIFTVLRYHCWFHFKEMYGNDGNLSLDSCKILFFWCSTYITKTHSYAHTHTHTHVCEHTYTQRGFMSSVTNTRMTHDACTPKFPTCQTLNFPYCREENEF